MLWDWTNFFSNMIAFGALGALFYAFIVGPTLRQRRIERDKHRRDMQDLMERVREQAIETVQASRVSGETLVEIARQMRPGGIIADDRVRNAERESYTPAQELQQLLEEQERLDQQVRRNRENAAGFSPLTENIRNILEDRPPLSKRAMKKKQLEEAIDNPPPPPKKTLRRAINIAMRNRK